VKEFLPKKLLTQIYIQAEEEYPEECCGIILESRGNFRMKSFRNAQNLFHEKDPQNFPRTAQEAFFINPSELLALQKEMRKSGEKIHVIYHSHPDSEARFSDEDKKQSLMGGEPAYPGVFHLVVSVSKGKSLAHRLYRWNSQIKDYEAF
jgi:proteasome lid subunit RPN8/RPN11